MVAVTCPKPLIYFQTQRIKHIFAARFHPHTVGKFEQLNLTAKHKLWLVIHILPDERLVPIKKLERSKLEHPVTVRRIKMLVTVNALSQAKLSWY